MTGILIDPTTTDIDVSIGSIVIGDNTAQCIEQIIISNRGEYKEFPLIGGELMKMSHGNHSRFWAGRVKNMCNAMGIGVNRVRLDPDGTVTVE